MVYIPISTYLDNAYIGTTYISLPTYIGTTYIPDLLIHDPVTYLVL